MAKYLDSSGITHLVTKLKGIFAAKATTLAGYGITNGVTTPSVSGSGNAVTSASVSGHTITLTKGSTFALASAVPKLRKETASNTVSNLSSTETLILDASTLSYTAGKQFWVNLLQADRNNGYGHYVGFVLTGANVCYIKWGGMAAYGGGGDQQLAAKSVYRFELFCYGKSSANFAKGYVTWTKLGTV